MKKSLLLTVLFVFVGTTAGAMAPSVDMMPYTYHPNKDYYHTQSRAQQNQQSAKSKSVYDYQDDEFEEKSAVTEKKQIKKNITPQNSSGKKPPMTYDRFPQNYDSSHSMMMMQQYGRMPGSY